MFGIFRRKKHATIATHEVVLPVARTQKNPIPTVKFDAKRVTAEVEAEIRAVIAETSEIPEMQRQDIFVAALAGVRAGGDLHTISQSLNAMDGVVIPKQRIGSICRQIHRRASALMDRNRQLSIGITEAKWLHSGAPCFDDPRNATEEDRARDTAHRAASGLTYNVKEGVAFDNRRIWPGQEPGCKCASKSIIPGFD